MDASIVVAALIDNGANGHWADQQLAVDNLAAPHLMPIEAENVLRRAEHAQGVRCEFRLPPEPGAGS